MIKNTVRKRGQSSSTKTTIWMWIRPENSLSSVHHTKHPIVGRITIYKPSCNNLYPNLTREELNTSAFNGSGIINETEEGADVLHNFV